MKLLFRHGLAMACLICGLLIGSLTARTSAQAQCGTTSSDSALGSLLQEVHALRLALERNSSADPLVQISVARLNIEEQRISALSAQLRQAEERMASAERDLATAQDRLRAVERTPTTGATRPDLSLRQEQAKRDIAAKESALTRLNGTVSNLQQQLATEQGHWGSVSQELDDLSRNLRQAARQ